VVGRTGSVLAQWVGFEPTSLKGHHDFEQIINLPNWSLIVLKTRLFIPLFQAFFANIWKFARKVRENCEKFQAAKVKNERKK